MQSGLGRQNYSNVGLLNFGSSSIYHSLQVKAEQRFASGLDFTVAYTWSKNIDDCSALFGEEIQNRYNMRAERAVTEGDQTHRLVTSYVYELPWGHGRKYWSGRGPLSVVLGNWQLGGANIPGTINTFGGTSTAEYGPLVALTYPCPAGAIARYNDFRNVLGSNPCAR